MVHQPASAPRAPELSARVFVYGTLRRGGSNHRLLRTSRRLGAWVTPRAYRMLDLGAYPGVVYGEDAIHGEVYAVSPAVLRRLDALEDHPWRYRRRPLDTPWGTAWIYIHVAPTGRPRRVRGGDWFARRAGCRRSRT